MCVGRNVDVHFQEVHLQASSPCKDSMENLWKEDALAISTKYTRTILFGFADLLQTIQNSTFFRIIFHTTQPAHLITAISVLAIAGFLIPSEAPHNVSRLWTLIYLGSFSMHLGAQIWMTFISGLSLYFSIPRHTFGCVQKVLFPKYFLLNAVLSFITLSVFLKTHNIQFGNIEINSQVFSMTLCFLIELLTRLYLTAPLLRLISSKNEIEKDAGVGMEVGNFKPGKLLENEEYMKLHKSFRKLHITIAIGNIISMACTMWHLYYLSQKISII
ncbi:transmembrane protein 205 [Coccinella septempunctata]|uniref:transmembrane protein 205 n=1 Tax=Coccinella septempunctata TaxID=41139 RepID=UPI001D096618|nr:transmembrane protein 205 [Coccinella septempunctata]